MNDKRNAKLRDALLKALAIAAFTAVPATVLAPVAQATVLLDDVNDGNCDLGQDDTGNGSASDPYRISTVEDLAEITDCEYDGDYYYLLTNDIDLTTNGNYNNDGFEWNGIDDGWSPIGQYAVYDFNDVTGEPYYTSDSFDGNFNGGGNTISNLYINNDSRSDDYLGLFSETSDAKISNLNIQGEIDAGDEDYTDYVGLLSGADYGSSIVDVHAEVNIYDGDDKIGGLIGQTQGSRISKSSTSGYIQGWDDYTDQMGGIVGQAEWDSNSATYLTNVSSSVELNNPAYDNLYYETVGGIVGEADDAIINHATFSGSAFGNHQVGGIVGYQSGSLINDAHVTEDVVISANPDLYVSEIGGIVGEADDTTISNSSFAGEIDAYQESTTDDAGYIGGIVGSTDYVNIIDVIVTDTAEINIQGNGSGSANVAGIVGYAVETSITAAVNDADLDVLNVTHVGGIVGEADFTSISSSLNRGDIHATLDDVSFNEGSVGGIIGLMDDANTISNSTNKGVITLDGADDSYGVGGLVGETAGDDTISDSYSTGAVNGSYNVGGVVGYINNDWTLIERSFGLGKLTATESDPDGIGTVDGNVTNSSNVVLLSDRADNETGAMELTAAEFKAATGLVAAGWAINIEDEDTVDGADWATSSDFNSGYPHLVWETVSENISDPIGLVDASFEPVQFNGKKRYTLTTSERNYLNSVANTINASDYASVDIDVYFGNKIKLAGKRANAVKRYLVKRFVGANISTHVLHADGSHNVGSVHITALAN